MDSYFVFAFKQKLKFKISCEVNWLRKSKLKGSTDMEVIVNQLIHNPLRA